MDTNKSIDGLSPRRPKPATSSATAKISTKKAPSKVQTPVKKPVSAKVKPTKAVATTKSTPKSHPSQPARKELTPKESDPIQISEDFLKPVQAFNFDDQSGELKAAEKPIIPTPTKKTKKSASRKRKIISRVILGFIIVAILAVVIFILYLNGIIAKITNNQGNLFDFLSENYIPLKTDENGRTNILAFGTSGYDMEGTEGEGTHDGAQLTDSIMIISLNQETGDFAMIGLPRDLKASPTCTATGKINEIYWCNNQDGNNEEAGAKALMDEVSNILGIDLQYYAHLNWGSLVQIVDALDGINVTLDEDVHDYYIFDAGVEYHLNGEEALRLARTRYGTAHGDFSRSASQQKILIGIKNKIFEKSLGLPEIISLANTLGDNLRVNLSADELKTLAHLTSSFDFNDMRQVSLIEPENYMTTATINGISYVLPIDGADNYTRIQEFVKKSFSNDPRDYEDPTILILNSTETPGLASTEENTLISEGYLSTQTGDINGNYTEKYTLYDVTNEKPGTKSLLEKKYSITSHSADELPADVNRDYDFIIIIGQSEENSEGN
ncbi:LCP family protein [Candidatus Saccharibacteria bacterium]|nr:LCP family protein [Candidatus Saccharibacteria bacterium]